MNNKLEKIIKERNKLLNQLPDFDNILRGTAFERFLKCGNKNCHCSTGKGHQAFYVGVTHAKAKTEQITLPESLFIEAKKQIASYDLSIRILNEISNLNRQILRIKRDEIKQSKRDDNAKRN